MEAFNAFLNELVNRNKLEFSGDFSVKWINPYFIEDVQQKRDDLLSNIAWLYKKTKPFYKSIPQGCQLCGEGKWSCLFITNQCNANCFYCPTSQEKDIVPGTQNLTFDTPESYAEYINFFNFKGVSFSGGEPFLYFDKTLSYLKALRQLCTPDLYIWIYTNGTLVTEQRLKQLMELGLNEIRFDIGATNFDITTLSNAAKYVEHVTIEIPAVPEEKNRIINLLPELIKVGVTHINLHQMRLTKYNFPKLVARNYTFIAAEQPLVLESEICALEILHYVQENKLPLGINYCSFHFKNRFQKAGYRKIILDKLKNENEIVTNNGYVRVFDNGNLHYERLELSDSLNNTSHGNELLIGNKKYRVKRLTGSEKWQIESEELLLVEELIGCNVPEIPTNSRLFRIWQNEHIEEGLRNY